MERPLPPQTPAQAAEAASAVARRGFRLSFRNCPQLYCFGGYLLLMTLALLWHALPVMAALFGGELILLIFLTARRIRSGQRSWLIAECLSYAVIMNIDFLIMGSVVPLMGAERFDHALLSADLLLLPQNLSFLLRPHAQPWLSDLMSACYEIFYPLLAWGFFRYLGPRQPLLESWFRGLFVIYGIGFSGYLLFPAAGPFHAFPDLFPTPLPGGAITRLNAALVAQGSNGVDAFPSLHCCITAYFLVFQWRHHRREFWWWLLPIIGLWAATIYLGYHYLADVLAGFTLAALVLYLTRSGGWLGPSAGFPRPEQELR